MYYLSWLCVQLLITVCSYLPPPVLNVMDNKRIEGTKRAALLTTALKWLMDHIPMAAVPVQVRPAMPLLKRIIPYMGYIGAFVAWSWDAIRAFDKGACDRLLTCSSKRN